RQALPCDINLECRGPLNATLDQRLGERVFNILLQSPAQRAGTVAAVRARFLENPLTSLRREDNLHLPVDYSIVHLVHEQVNDAEQVLVAERVEDNDFVQPV